MRDLRAQIRRDLDPLFIPYYDALCAKLPLEWQPYSGHRSIPSQEKLYAQGRTSPGKVVTNARGGQSPHNYGMATDWTIWINGEPQWKMKKEDPRWHTFINAVTEVGLRSGSEFGDVDHAELRIAVPWSTIGTIFLEKGMNVALSSVRAAMIPPPGFNPIA
jgi:hypothetical protein